MSDNEKHDLLRRQVISSVLRTVEKEINGRPGPSRLQRIGLRNKKAVGRVHLWFNLIFRLIYGHRR